MASMDLSLISFTSILVEDNLFNCCSLLPRLELMSYSSFILNILLFPVYSVLQKSDSIGSSLRICKMTTHNRQ